MISKPNGSAIKLFAYSYNTLKLLEFIALDDTEIFASLGEELGQDGWTSLRRDLRKARKIIADGGKVILMSHLGRPKGGPEDKFSLKHLVDHLYNLLNPTSASSAESAGEQIPTRVFFANDCIGEQAAMTASLIFQTTFVKN